MIEREMQELLWRYPERFLNEPLQQFAWEVSSAVGRADLVFEDRHGRLLIIEVERGKLPRGAIDQLLDYFGMMKLKFPEKPVEMMVVANVIPPERQLTCESREIECRSISEKVFREIAAEVGYTFSSELSMPDRPASASAPVSVSSSPPRHSGGQDAAGWTFSGTVQSPADVQDFLSRCDKDGGVFFSALFEAQKAASARTKITWDHQSGFSMQFNFHRVGFVPIMWGFPAKNRGGKSIRQRLDFPFDVSIKAGAPTEFVDELGTALSLVVQLSGGRKRPSIPIVGLQADETAGIIVTVFNFAVKSGAP
jgi:hypothetical protein